MRICFDKGLSKKELRIIEFIVDMPSKQKHIFELSYGHSKLIEPDHYIDYDYSFKPQKTYDDCILLMNKLLKEPKYCLEEDKSFNDDSDQGFWITEYELDELFGI